MGKDDTDECSTNPNWKLSYEYAGAHMHYQTPNVNEPEGKVYARCSASRKFATIDRTVAGSTEDVGFNRYQNLSMDTFDSNGNKVPGNSRLWVRGGMNVYDSDKKIVDQRSADW